MGKEIPFKHFGAMLDCSRNGVMKPRVVKTMIDYLSQMGYNTLMLYTEAVSYTHLALRQSQYRLCGTHDGQSYAGLCHDAV